MYATKELVIGLPMEGERFQLDLVVQQRFTATVAVRQVQWVWYDYDIGKPPGDYLLAIGRWVKRDGSWSNVDARSPVREDQLPPAVLAKLKELKGE